MKTFREFRENVHARYMRAHGKKASGSGLWIFTTQRMGSPNDKDTFDHNGNFSDALKAAQKHFGTKNVYVMESIEENKNHPKYKAAKRDYKAGVWDGNVDKDGNPIVHINGKPVVVK